MGSEMCIRDRYHSNPAAAYFGTVCCTTVARPTIHLFPAALYNTTTNRPVQKKAARKNACNFSAARLPVPSADRILPMPMTCPIDLDKLHLVINCSIPQASMRPDVPGALDD